MTSLHFLNGPQAGLRRDVTATVVLGRSPSCDIPLDDDKVSRRHVSIRQVEGQLRLEDLHSRNGTVVNGEKVEGEVVLLPGDRIQVGVSTLVVERPGPATLGDREDQEASFVPIAEVLPHVGAEALLYTLSTRLLSATSEAMVLRRCADELLRLLNVDRAAALIGGPEGLSTAAVAGSDHVEVPSQLVKAALERRELARSRTALCAPIAASGRSTFGVIYVARAEALFTPSEGRWLATVGRLAGEAFAAVQGRTRDAPPPSPLWGNSAAFVRVLEALRRASLNAKPLFLSGPAGTGKRSAAHHVHAHSQRALGPFVGVDCRKPVAALDEELFARTTGVPTSALFSALLRADGGTLLLHHVEALPKASADRLTRLLAEGLAPAREGGEEPVDLRVMATSTLSLAQLQAQSPDAGPLWERLGSGLELALPSLRDRSEDIPSLFDAFADRQAKSAQQAIPQLAAESRRLLTAYAWPGNIRELRSVAERLAFLYPAGWISPLRLPPEIQYGQVAGEPSTLQERVAHLEREAVLEALREASGKKVKAAELLGISRPTLDKKIAEFGITVEKGRND